MLKLEVLSTKAIRRVLLLHSLYLCPSMLTQICLFQANQVPLDLTHHLRLHPVMEEGPLQDHKLRLQTGHNPHDCKRTCKVPAI